MRIVPIALKEYFVNNVPMEETITNHTDILDFCKELKVKRDYETEYSFINSDNWIEKEILGKITRYFISGKNGMLLKKNVLDGRTTHIDKGYGIKIFNRAYKATMKEYDIDYDYYLMEANKIKNSVYDGQLSLF